MTNKKEYNLYFTDEEWQEGQEKRRMIERHIDKSDKRLEVATKIYAAMMSNPSNIERTDMLDSAITYADLLIQKIYYGV